MTYELEITHYNHYDDYDEKTHTTMTAVNSIPTFLSQYKNDNYIQGWSELWNRADNLPWDKGFPNPALEDTLIQYAPTIGSSTISHKEGNQVPIRRKKALVPGCGRGVDVLLLASFGYDAFGLECSAAALGKCKEEEGKVKEEGRYPVRYDGERFGRGKVVFVQGDFFKDDWLWALGMPGTDAGGCFDLVYDYTVGLYQISAFVLLLLRCSVFLLASLCLGILCYIGSVSRCRYIYKEKENNIISHPSIFFLFAVLLRLEPVTSSPLGSPA